MAINVDKMQIQIHIVIPELPKFLKATNGDVYNLSEITKKDLKKIAKIWSKDLIDKGKEQKP